MNVLAVVSEARRRTSDKQQTQQGLLDLNLLRVLWRHDPVLFAEDPTRTLSVTDERALRAIGTVAGAGMGTDAGYFQRRGKQTDEILNESFFRWRSLEPTAQEQETSNVQS